ncbi:STAS domain-containing protein, partial [Methylomagnum sp.]
DMRRVQSVDVTAAHVLEQIKDQLAEREGFLIFSQLPSRVPSGLDMQRYFNQVGLVRNQRAARIFSELDEAVQWIEDRILEEASVVREEENSRPLGLGAPLARWGG